MPAVRGHRLEKPERDRHGQGHRHERGEVVLVDVGSGRRTAAKGVAEVQGRARSGPELQHAQDGLAESDADENDDQLLHFLARLRKREQERGQAGKHDQPRVLRCAGMNAQGPHGQGCALSGELERAKIGTVARQLRPHNPAGRGTSCSKGTQTRSPTPQRSPAGREPMDTRKKPCRANAAMPAIPASSSSRSGWGRLPPSRRGAKTSRKQRMKNGTRFAGRGIAGSMVRRQPSVSSGSPCPALIRRRAPPTPANPVPAMEPAGKAPDNASAGMLAVDPSSAACQIREVDQGRFRKFKACLARGQQVDLVAMVRLQRDFAAVHVSHHRAGLHHRDDALTLIEHLVQDTSHKPRLGTDQNVTVDLVQASDRHADRDSRGSPARRRFAAEFRAPCQLASGRTSLCCRDGSTILFGPGREAVASGRCDLSRRRGLGKQCRRRERTCQEHCNHGFHDVLAFHGPPPATFKLYA